ncbi:MAG: glycosyltransferase family 2 protein [Candidatus Hodarchaeota archaeon]
MCYISIVIPVYNEKDSISELYQEIVSAISSYSYEIIFIDDGSEDNSLLKLQELIKLDKNIKVIRFRKNYGKAAVLSAGFKMARGDIIITMDADLQDNPAEIRKFIEKIEEGNDLVCGWKYQGKGKLSRTLPSRFFNKVVAFITKIKLHDFNCPFKAYRNNVAKEISLYGELHRFIPILVEQKGHKLTEIKVENRPRKYGNSKYGRERFLRGFLDFLTVLLVTGYSSKPLHFFGLVGVISSLLGITINSIYSIFELLLPLNIKVEFPILLLGTLLIILGFQLISFGLISEMFVYTLYKKEDSYFIEQIIEQDSRA